MPDKRLKSNKKLEGITLLGDSTIHPPTHPSEARLETFENAFPGRDYLITLDCPDFTSLCPVTGQADFAHIIISYVPAKKCVETKSLKLYLASYRNERAFNEEVINHIFADIKATCGPQQLRVEGKFAARGGISLSVVVQHPKPSRPK